MGPDVIDIVADNFWGDERRAFFDVRVFHSTAQSYRQTRLDACYRSKECEKRRSYEEGVRAIERGTFAHGMAPTATIMYKRMASLIADRKKQPYHLTISMIRCQISFTLIRSAIRYLRGYCYCQGHPRC